MRTCTKCGVAKPDSEFDRHHKREPEKLRPECKACKRAYNRQWARKNPLRARNWELKAKFGISFQQKQEMLDAQNGLCMICESPPGQRALHVDHNHATGQVRALLCVHCNTMLGYARENPLLLEAAARYLRKFAHDAARVEPKPAVSEATAA